MTKLIAVVALSAFALTSSSFAFAAAMKNGAKPTSKVTFRMRAESKSGEKGWATLTPQGFATKVTITLTGEPAGASQPAHFHVGKCQNVGAVVYPLNPVVGGTSTTTINKTIKTIEANSTLINVHESAKNLARYVSCGAW